MRSAARTDRQMSQQIENECRGHYTLSNCQLPFCQPLACQFLAVNTCPLCRGGHQVPSCPLGPQRPCAPQVYSKGPEVDMYTINDQCLALWLSIIHSWFCNCMLRRCRKFGFAESYVNVGIEGKVRAVVIVQLVARLLPALMHLEAATCQGCQMYLVLLCPSYSRYRECQSSVIYGEKPERTNDSK